jgi:molybdate transport system regulatory protein
MPDNYYNVRFRIWIDNAESKEPFLGLGRVLLLEKIKATGSISAAAKEMQMSYRQAWQLVTDMNKNAPSPLVEKQTGGKGGGGAVLTAAGERAVSVFYEIESCFRTFVADKFSKIDI